MSSRMTGMVFRFRGRIAVAAGLAALAYLFLKGPDLLAAEPWEAGGLTMIVLGHLVRVAALRSIGPSSRTRVARADHLVTDGPYAVVRNPLYLGNGLIAAGLCLVAHVRWLMVAGPLGCALLYFVVVLHEEQVLRDKLGQPYLAYCQAVPRFWPRALATAAGWRTFWAASRRWNVFRSKEYWALVNTGVALLLFEMAEHSKFLRIL